MNQKHLQIRETTPADAVKFRALRLEALLAHPEAFGADYETDKNLPHLSGKKARPIIGNPLHRRIDSNRSERLEKTFCLQCVMRSVWGSYVRRISPGKARRKID